MARPVIAKDDTCFTLHDGAWEIVRIGPDGKVTFGVGMTAEEASRQFFTLLAQQMGRMGTDEDAAERVAEYFWACPPMDLRVPSKEWMLELVRIVRGGEVKS